jgi:hypothetical protein
METGGTTPAGSGRNVLRLDPFALPVSFPAYDAGADGEMRQVELDRERVVMRRAVRGIPMAVGVPVCEFRGLTLRVVSFGDGGPKAIAIVLEHQDASLSLPLYVAEKSEDIIVICKAWSRVLRLPLLTDPHPRPRRRIVRLGALAIGKVAQRRRRRAAIRQRRPSILMRRKPGCSSQEPMRHCGEREIIARN